MTSSTATKALIVAMGAAMADAFTVPLQGGGMVASVAARRPLLLCESAGNAGGHMQGQPHGGTRQKNSLGRAPLPAVRMNMKGDAGESHSPQVDAALQTSHPLFRKRYLFTLIAVTFFAAFRSVVLHPLNYGVGLIMAPLAWIATAVPVVMLMFFNPFSPFFFLLTMPIMVIAVTGLLIKAIYVSVLEVMIWIGRVPSFVGIVIEPLRAVVDAIECVPILRTVLALKGLPDYLILQASRAEEMYQARRLSGGQITNRISALLIKAAGTTIQTLTRPIAFLSRSPVEWGRQARLSAQQRLSRGVPVGFWVGRMRFLASSEERKVIRLLVAAFRVMDDEGKGLSEAQVLSLLGSVQDISPLVPPPSEVVSLSLRRGGGEPITLFTLVAVVQKLLESSSKV